MSDYKSLPSEFGGLFKTADDVWVEFRIDPVPEAHILYAWYDYEAYDGAAVVIFAVGDELYEVTGGHCSCYGLEGQWEPGRIVPQYLAGTNPDYKRRGPGFESFVQRLLAAMEAQS